MVLEPIAKMTVEKVDALVTKVKRFLLLEIWSEAPK